jgi:hypothetical protein
MKIDINLNKVMTAAWLAVGVYSFMIANVAYLSVAVVCLTIHAVKWEAFNK